MNLPEIKNMIHRLSAEYLDEIITIRRHLHRHPELSMEEVKTSAYIAAKLDEYHIPYKKGIAQTGIVATIEGMNPSAKTIALRADMDALPITESCKTEFASANPGVMHACGHDVHIASLLGAAKIMNGMKQEFSGSIRLIFQPSEEKFPGGAFMMINEGVLENPKPENIVAQHVLPSLEVGKIGIRSGKYMASTDEIYLTVIGKGGHGATPELNVDPVVIAAHIIVALQQIVSRNASPTIPTVLSFGKLIANGRTNIIPDEVIIEGTIRTFDETWRAEAHQRITKMAQSLAEGMGGSCKVFIDKGYPYLINDEPLSNRIQSYAIDYLGRENVEQLDLRMAAEDFAYYSQQIPASLYRLGIRNEAKGIVANVHTSTFDVDEQCLKTGMGFMAWVALNELNQ